MHGTLWIWGETTVTLFNVKRMGHKFKPLGFHPLNTCITYYAYRHTNKQSLQIKKISEN